jgi:membrane-bound lytic murein transglycosylase D
MPNHLRPDLRLAFVLIVIAMTVGACAPTRGPFPTRQTFEPDRAAAPAAFAEDCAGIALGDHLRRTVKISEISSPREFGFAVDPIAPPGASPFDLAHPAVDRYIAYYCDRSPQTIEASLSRALPHLPFIRQTLSKAGVPTEIAYLPIVESRFEDNARSGAGATGIWQFMRATAAHYGLRIDGCIDERRDPIRSTEAAARYLAALHQQFNDWHLALAAFNVGEGRIQRIMRDHGIDDYWTMVERQLLPRETAQYVPKFLAAAAIAENPDSFGLLIDTDSGPGNGAPMDFATVRIADPISLKTVAALAGVDRETVQALNPALACSRIPRGGYGVRLPRNAVGTFQQAYARRDALATIEAGSGAGVHRVRRGDNPASIARRYGVSVRALMRANDLRDPRRLRVNDTLRIPGRS